jgi:uncharacterized protein YggE
MLSIETARRAAAKRIDPRFPAVLLMIAIAAMAFSAAAQTSSPLPPGLRTIEVSGTGEVRAKPDTASINVAIETQATTAERCATLNAALAQKVAGALKSKLGDRGKIETAGYSVLPEYDQRPKRDRPRVVGYQAVNSISITTGHTDLAGPLIDTALGAGANRINSMNFALKDETEVRAVAITRASKDAQAQASTLAASLGVKLKRIYSATTVSEPVGVAMGAAAAFGSAVPNVPPVEVHEVPISANVTLVYEIE